MLHPFCAQDGQDAQLGDNHASFAASATARFAADVPAGLEPSQ
jgi:hypothetical protein